MHCDPETMRTSGFSGMAAGAMELLPGLGDHACRTDCGKRFVDELPDTELAHLLEHMAVELIRMTGVRGGEGETRWDFRRDGRGVFHVLLKYQDDLVALGALKLAAECVRWLAGVGEKPEIQGEVRRLGGLRRAGKRGIAGIP